MQYRRLQLEVYSDWAEQNLSFRNRSSHQICQEIYLQAISNISSFLISLSPLQALQLTTSCVILLELYPIPPSALFVAIYIYHASCPPLSSSLVHNHLPIQFLPSKYFPADPQRSRLLGVYASRSWASLLGKSGAISSLGDIQHGVLRSAPAVQVQKLKRYNKTDFKSAWRQNVRPD
jgi:hypothetical protein